MFSGHILSQWRRFTQRRCRASSTTREAASRFFFLLFWTPVSDVFLASTIAIETFDLTTMRTIVHEPRSGEPNVLLFWTPHNWCFPGIYYRNWDIWPNEDADRASSTSREAASRIFLLFWTRVSDVFLASTIAMETFDPASSTSREAASRFFFAILNPRMSCFPGIY